MNEKNKMTYLAFFPDWLEILEPLPDADFRKVVSFASDYATKGTSPQGLSGMTLMAFTALKKDIDRSVQKFNDKREAYRRNGKKGGETRALNARIKASMEEEQATLSWA